MLKSSSRLSRLIASLALGASVLYVCGDGINRRVVFDADSGQILESGRCECAAQTSLAKMMTLYRL